jgi:hypothetical protein
VHDPGVPLSFGPTARLGRPSSPLRFGEEKKPGQDWVGRRVLHLDGEPAFELSFWCGTCGFLFRRLEGANRTLSLDELQDRLTDGLSGFDEEVIGAFAALLPEDDYLPLLLSLTPRLITPMRDGDYFAEEHLATWGPSPFWGLPEYPRTPYYRTFETPVSTGAHLFEFVVPMTPPTWNDEHRVAEHAGRLASTSAPTAVALSTLDVTQPAMDSHSTDYYQHWGLTHFLLDGHHKMQAAAETGRPLQLLSLVAVGASLATPEQVSAIPALRARPAAPRTPPATAPSRSWTRWRAR